VTTSPELTLPPLELAETAPATWNLDEQDLAWIRGYIPGSSAAETAFSQLDELGRVGSIHQRLIKDPSARDAALEARGAFLKTLGIAQETIDIARNRNGQRAFLIPTSSFVDAQRALHAQGMDMRQLTRAYRLNPSLLAYSATNWSKRYEHLGQHLAQMDSNDVSAQSLMRSILSRAPRALHESATTLAGRLTHLTSLGIALKTVQKQPILVTLNRNMLAAKMEYLATTSSDAATVLNRAPTVSGLSIDTISSRVANLSRLGLNPTAVIDRFPKVLTSTEQTIAYKAAYIMRVAAFLGWDADPHELINAYPSILSAANPRLRLLARVFATSVHSSRQQAPIKTIGSALITPIDSYIIALGDARYDHENLATDSITLAKVATNRLARDKQQQPANRKQHAQEALPRLYAGNAGKIALMYEQYSTKED
jgi:hypothetical protein